MLKVGAPWLLARIPVTACGGASQDMSDASDQALDATAIDAVMPDAQPMYDAPPWADGRIDAAVDCPTQTTYTGRLLVAMKDQIVEFTTAGDEIQRITVPPGGPLGDTTDNHVTLRSVRAAACMPIRACASRPSLSGNPARSRGAI